MTAVTMLALVTIVSNGNAASAPTTLVETTPEAPTIADGLEDDSPCTTQEKLGCLVDAIISCFPWLPGGWDCDYNNGVVSCEVWCF